MKYATFTALCFGLLLALSGAMVAAEEPPVAPPDTVTPDTHDAVVEQPAGPQVIAYYFHGNRRCATCQKLEAYAQEAVTGEFADEIEQGLVEWRVVNFDEEANEHYLKDYGLFSQTVILSRIDGEKETEWKNLDRIWKLVGDKDAYVTYVRDELRAFLMPDEK